MNRAASCDMNKGKDFHVFTSIRNDQTQKTWKTRKSKPKKNPQDKLIVWKGQSNEKMDKKLTAAIKAANFEMETWRNYGKLYKLRMRKVRK